MQAYGLCQQNVNCREKQTQFNVLLDQDGCTHSADVTPSQHMVMRTCETSFDAAQQLFEHNQTVYTEASHTRLQLSMHIRTENISVTDGVMTCKQFYMSPHAAASNLQRLPCVRVCIEALQQLRGDNDILLQGAAL